MAVPSLVTSALATVPAVPAADGVTPSVLLTYIQDGGIVSYLLIGLSILALTIAIRNAIVFRYRMFAPPRVMQALEGLLASGRIDSAQDFCEHPSNRSFITTVLAEAFRRTSGSAPAEFRATVEDVAQAEADEVHRMNDGLGIIAAIGPMLGLLGTVFGMIGAFRTIGALEGAARSNQLATFMSMALVNTAEGLIVAIPSTIAFALFRRKIDRILKRVSRDLERFAAYVVDSGAAQSVRAETLAQPVAQRAPAAAGSSGPRT
ncbi:MAG: MotA/TolQ/ExbB proton channel family protein [Phycisphaerae bacterium]|nr:MotA/TolQ/ExbB proton channel family protein [Phycisphaerae bacterium]